MDLRNFLQKYERCYGFENLVYNVHFLQHVPDDARAHEPTDSFSAFTFNTYVKQIKKSMHSGLLSGKQLSVMRRKCLSVVIPTSSTP